MVNFPQTILRYLGLGPLGTPEERCAELAQARIRGATSITADYVLAGSNFTVPGSCQSSATTEVNICRVYASVNTTRSSSVRIEAWFPDEWYGRMLEVREVRLSCSRFGKVKF